ncbi:hypothetical protein CNMCM7691_000516 [Aspergillus felis]|uniref:FAD-binding PCMH-type domain-containing protein n=1 Tax=Aspergillus felis TaxID=1287682 RepID=A0A8H6QYE4_9EURO|nr:hypothetical protein CNMCM7691_000516 [Aspergillus felis]
MAFVFTALLGAYLGWESCWPSASEWAALNSTLRGDLLEVRPIAHVCHDPFYNHSACQNLLDLARDSGWRASQPGALQGWIWEAGRTEDETCHAHSPRGVPCHQGRIPLYSAAVESVDQVQAAVRFAQRHRLRLVVRNTGHDTAGRSSGSDSFQIHCHRMKQIEYHDNFRPIGSDIVHGPAVSVGAGVVLGEVYERGARDGWVVVGGECPTVGAAGGFLQGGGVSSFHSFINGLAVDNVLEFEVVTAKGEVVVANDHQNPHLFWALRGGGGGTFGFVTRATMRVHRNGPVCMSEVAVSGPRNNSLLWTRGIAGLFSILRSFNQQGTPGQFILQSLSDHQVNASLTLYSLNTNDTRRVAENMLSIQKVLESTTLPFSLASTCLSKVSDVLRKGPDILPASYGILTGSVLVSEDLFNSEQGPLHLANQLQQFPMGPEDLLFTSNLGGNVTADPGKKHMSISMHPGWRQAAHLINFVRSVSIPTTHEKARSLEELHSIQMRKLYNIEPGFRVSYRNLGDPLESDAARVYWGPNYKRLLEIKRKWDPEDVFFSQRGVGSEGWADDRMSPAIIDIRQSKFESSIPDQVIEGLTKEVKTLPALLFYSTEGIRHWNHHSHAADFYPRLEELCILKAEASKMAASIAEDSLLIDMGSASMDKVILLLDALEEQKKSITYYALDLSYSELASNLQAIPVDRFHHVRFSALHGTFDDGLHWLQNAPEIRNRPRCILLFGLTIGNFSRENAASFLRNIAESALATSPAQSSIIVSLDSCKLPTKILRAYTADGVVPFALASLGYANSLFHPEGNGEVFNEQDWYFHSEWNHALGRHEASLITRSKDVQLGAPLGTVVVRRDEKIRFGCSYKYDRDERGQLSRSAGLQDIAEWTAPDCDVAFYQLGLLPN